MNKNYPALNYEVIGEGRPIVFIHGFLEDSSMWKFILPHLKNVKAIFFELPGHGKSPNYQGDLSIPLIADSIEQTLDKLQITNYSIIGHSMGGYVTLQHVKTTKHTIEQVVLFHSHPWADSPEKKINRTRAANIVTKSQDLYVREAITDLYAPNNHIRLKEDIEHAIKIAQHIDGEAVIQCLLAMRDREDLSHVLFDFGKRLSVIHGEFDPLIDTEEITEITTRAKNNFYFIPDIGHIGYNEAPGKVIEILSGIFNLS